MSQNKELNQGHTRMFMGGGGSTSKIGVDIEQGRRVRSSRSLNQESGVVATFYGSIA